MPVTGTPVAALWGTTSANHGRPSLDLALAQPPRQLHLLSLLDVPLKASPDALTDDFLLALALILPSLASSYLFLSSFLPPSHPSLLLIPPLPTTSFNLPFANSLPLIDHFHATRVLMVPRPPPSRPTIHGRQTISCNRSYVTATNFVSSRKRSWLSLAEWSKLN